MRQEVKWDEKTNTCTLVTKHSDNMISVEPLTIEEAAEWSSRLKGY